MELKSAREQLIDMLEGLPAEAVADITKYAEYVRHKFARQKPIGRKLAGRRKHPAEGIWVDRNDIANSGAYSLELRRMIEARQDGTVPH